MTTLTLAPITRAAKNILRDNGEIFRVIEERSPVLFTDRPGPWLLLESMKDVEAGKGPWSYAMWVAEQGDEDYRIVGREGNP